MARPTTRRRSMRVQVAQPPRSPGLDVVAPLAVKTPEAHSPLEGLVQALGIGVPIAAQAKKERDDYWKAQGAADEKMGKGDMALAQRHKAYADGAYEVAILEQYHEAEREVAEWAASDELDKSLPVEEQLLRVDGQLKSRLGPLVADPRAKLLIAERYQQFVDTFAGNVVEGQAKANAEAAQQVAIQDIQSQIDKTGSFNWDEQFRRLYSQSGDPVQSNTLLVGAVAQMIEDAATNGEDFEQYRALIPTEVTGPDGQKLPGPMYNPKYRAVINQAMAQAEGLRHKFYQQQYAASQYKAYTTLDAMIGHSLITDDTFASLGITIGDGPQYDLSPLQAANYRQQSQTALAKHNVEDLAFENARGLVRTLGDGRWRDIIGASPDLSQGKVQKFFDQDAQNAAAGMGLAPEHMLGAGMVNNPEAVRFFATYSAQHGMVYTPLKQTLTGISQAAPGDIAPRVEAYKELKRNGVVGDYVNDEAAVIYEAALGGTEAGLKGPEVAERIRTMGDKATAQYVSDQLREIDFRKSGFEIDTDAGLFGTGDVNITKSLTAPLVLAKAESLAAYALSKGMSATEAKAFAETRIKQTHVPLPVGDQWAVLPAKDVGDVKTTSAALEWYESRFDALKAKHKLPADEPLTIRPTMQLGRGLAFEVLRPGGIPIERFNVGGLVAAYRRAVPADAKAGAIEASKAEQKRKSAIDAAMQDNPALFNTR